MVEDNDMSSIINKFKTIMSTNEKQSSSNTTEGSSNQGFNITPEMINNMANILKNSKNNSSDTSNKYDNSNTTASEGTSNIDFDTIIKIKSLMEKLNNKNDPRSNLLYSLKPYLRETRKKKLDQYVNLLKITEVTNLFKDGKGDGS